VRFSWRTNRCATMTVTMMKQNDSTLNLQRQHCRSVVYLACVLEVQICVRLGMEAVLAVCGSSVG
jgi:hypothetical protein